MWLFAIIFVSRKITPLNGLSKWSLLELFKRALQISSPKRSPNEVSKFRTGSSLLGACWKIVGSLIYGIHGIISFQSSSLNGLSKKLSKWALQMTFRMSSPNELSKWALQIETWLEYPGSLLGGCWEDSGSPLLIILEFGGLFNHKFCKFLCLVRYERNLWKMNHYLVSKIKKSCIL